MDSYSEVAYAPRRSTQPRSCAPPKKCQDMSRTLSSTYISYKTLIRFMRFPPTFLAQHSSPASPASQWRKLFSDDSRSSSRSAVFSSCTQAPSGVSGVTTHPDESTNMKSDDNHRVIHRVIHRVSHSDPLVIHSL
jgi:hypothetical protein